MIKEYRNGKSITKIANESKYGWRRVSKLFKFLLTLPNFEENILPDSINYKMAYKYINKKYLHMEEINDR